MCRQSIIYWQEFFKNNLLGILNRTKESMNAHIILNIHIKRVVTLYKTHFPAYTNITAFFSEFTYVKLIFDFKTADI